VSTAEDLPVLAPVPDVHAWPTPAPLDDDAPSGDAPPADDVADDVPVSRDITEWRVLGLLVASIGTVILLGVLLRSLDLEGPPLPLNIGAKLLTATVALSVVDRLGWWHRIGCRGPSRWKRLGLAWLPILYVAWFSVPGIPLTPAARTAGILVLGLAIGLDEEVWTRGLLLESLRHRGTTRAVIYSALAFGLLHLVNVAGGQPVSSTLVQVFVAVAFGFGLGALRVRCHSIWPSILVHATWDFVLIARSGELGTSEGTTSGQALVTALIFVPLAIYGLVLARPSKVPGPDGRMRRPGAPVPPSATTAVFTAAPPATPADALGRWPTPPPDVEAIRRGW
jgi:membrane protease YdiL (CAAX protease family)